jgi:hypothetical protein
MCHLLIARIDQITAAIIWLVAETHFGRVASAEGSAAPALHSGEGVQLAAILLANLSA